MKKVLIVTLIFFLMVGCVNSRRQATKTPLENIKVFEVAKFKKVEIYEGSKKWVAERFGSAKNVIQYDSKENGQLVLKGYIEYPEVGLYGKMSGFLNNIRPGHGSLVSFTLIEEIKDGRFRLIVKDLEGVDRRSARLPLDKETSDAATIKILSFGDMIIESMKAPLLKKEW